MGNLVRFELLPGNRYDTVGVASLIDGIDLGALLGDKAFDADWIVEDIDARGAIVCISQRHNRKNPRQIDREMYKWRHLIENFFAKLKEFKKIAMRACKTDQSFRAVICLTATTINLR